LSGPKSTYVRPSLSRAARQRLRHFLPMLRKAESEARSVRSSSDLERLESLIRSLRTELSQFQTAAERRGEALGVVRNSERSLANSRKVLSSLPDAAEFADMARSIELALGGDSTVSVDRIRMNAEHLLARTSEAQAAAEQVRGRIPAVERALTAARPAQGGRSDVGQIERDFDAGIRDAIEKAVDAEANAPANAPSDAVSLGGLDSAAHGRLLATAREYARKADVDAANAAIGEARKLRERAAHRGGEVREQIVQREELASRLAAALESRNYDSVHAYYSGPADSGDTAPLVLYASNPAGKAHVRVTLGIDGSMVLEVDGVADGEEEVCLDVLATFSRTVADGGDELEIRDFGRAKGARRQATLQKDRESKERQD
jgi:hypothetical protein